MSDAVIFYTFCFFAGISFTCLWILYVFVLPYKAAKLKNRKFKINTLSKEEYLELKEREKNLIKAIAALSIILISSIVAMLIWFIFTKIL